ncbi:MAG: calcium-binding protein [Planctomycetota bacterium]
MKHSLTLFFLIAALIPQDVFGQGIVRLSVDVKGVEGNSLSVRPVVSGDGRYIAFTSAASNLVPMDTNGQADVFVFDRILGITTLISKSSTGVQGTWGGGNPAISGDGRFIAFDSQSDNLVSGDANGEFDIFVHDRLTSETTRVSVDSYGAEGNGYSVFPSISADGSTVAFESWARNLVPGDTNAYGDVFVHEMASGITTRVSVRSSGVEAIGASQFASLSADGRFVAFHSRADNLVQGDSNRSFDTFLHDRSSGQTTRVSVSSAGAEGDYGTFAVYAPGISANGRVVAFSSWATNLVAGDTNATCDIFVHDRVTGNTSRVSIDSQGLQGNGLSRIPTLSGDGRFVAFDSTASNLVSGDTNQVNDVFVHDRLSGSTHRVNVDSAGGQGDLEALDASISGNGRYVVFESPSSNLVSGDLNGVSDIFLFDQFGPALSKEGTCPGNLTLTVSGGVIGQNVVLVYGRQGVFVKPGPPCQGIVLDLANPTFGVTVQTKLGGVAVVPLIAPAGACGQTIQAVDLSTCNVSNPIVL